MIMQKKPSMWQKVQELTQKMLNQAQMMLILQQDKPNLMQKMLNSMLTPQDGNIKNCLVIAYLQGIIQR